MVQKGVLLFRNSWIQMMEFMMGHRCLKKIQQKWSYAMACYFSQ